MGETKEFFATAGTLITRIDVYSDQASPSGTLRVAYEGVSP